MFEEFATVFAGDLGNVIVGELLEGFFEDGLESGCAGVHVFRFRPPRSLRVAPPCNYEDVTGVVGRGGKRASVKCESESVNGGGWRIEALWRSCGEPCDATLVFCLNY